MENVKDPENHIGGVLDCVKNEYLVKTYGIEEYRDPEDFLVQLANKSGRLLKVWRPGQCCLLHWHLINLWFLERGTGYFYRG